MQGLRPTCSVTPLMTRTPQGLSNKYSLLCEEQISLSLFRTVTSVTVPTLDVETKNRQNCTIKHPPGVLCPILTGEYVPLVMNPRSE